MKTEADLEAIMIGFPHSYTMNYRQLLYAAIIQF